MSSRPEKALTEVIPRQMALHPMQEKTGSSHSQGQVHPPFRYKSNDYPLASLQRSNPTPAPVGSPHISDDGMHTNIVESQPRNTQMSQAHTYTAQIGYLETSAGQQRAYSKPNVHGHSSQGFISSSNTDLQQRQHLSSASSAVTSSPALTGGGHGVLAHDKLFFRKSNIPASSLAQAAHDEIQEYIKKSLEDVLSKNAGSDRNVPGSNTVGSRSCGAMVILCEGQRTSAVRFAVQKDSSKGSNANAEFTVKSRDTGDCPTVASDHFSTGTILSPMGSTKQIHLRHSLSLDNDASVDTQEKCLLML